MEWDSGNFKSFRDIFGLKEKKQMTVSQRHSIISKVYIQKMLMFYKKYKETGYRFSDVSFTGNFKNDIRNFGESNHINLGEPEIGSIFPEDFNPYENVDESIKICAKAIATAKANIKKGKASHPPFSSTWTQFYNYQTSGGSAESGADGPLISMYRSYFKSHLDLDENSSLRVAQILFEKCFALAKEFGRKFSLSEISTKSSGEIQMHGLNLLIAEHDRSDLAMGEKKAIANVMKAFCLQPNEFKVSRTCVTKTLLEDLSEINFIKEEAYHSPIERSDLGNLSFLNSKVLKKHCNQKELSLVKKINEKKDINSVNSSDYESLEISDLISRDDFEIFIKSSYKLFTHGYTCIVQSKLSQDLIKKSLEEYYSEGYVSSMVSSDPDEFELWGVTFDDLSGIILKNLYPLESDSMAHPDLFKVVKDYVKQNVPNNYLVKKTYIVKK